MTPPMVPQSNNGTPQQRIVFMGTPDFAAGVLTYLIDKGYNIVAVVTTPDKQAGRGLKVHTSAVKECAIAHNLPILQPEMLRDPSFVEQLASYKADIFAVVAFRMLPEVVWKMPQLGSFNLHASLLPNYRGAAPINRAIINGETQTGVTTFLLDHKTDTGQILLQKAIDIAPEDNFGLLHDKLLEIGAPLTAETIDILATGKAVSMPQKDTEDLKPAPKIFKPDCKIDWQNMGMIQIQNLIRGLSPVPGAWSIMKSAKGEIEVKLFESKISLEQHNCQPGTVKICDKRLFVYGVDGKLEVLSLQVSGKKRMATKDFLAGFRETDNCLLFR